MSESKSPSYFWVPLFVVFWPAVLLLISWLRFGTFRGPMDVGGTEFWSGIVAFATTGLVSGVGLLWLMRFAKTRRQKKYAFVGYLLALPAGFIGTLLGPLATEAFYGVPIPPAVVFYVLYPLFGAINGSLFLVGIALAGKEIARTAEIKVA